MVTAAGCDRFREVSLVEPRRDLSGEAPRAGFESAGSMSLETRSLCFALLLGGHYRTCLLYTSVLSLEVEGSGADACRLAEALNLFTLAPSLGSVDSLVTIPLLTSHYRIDPALLSKIGVTEQMIRLSVGIEHVDDLIADLEKGLAVLSQDRVRAGVAD